MDNDFKNIKPSDYSPLTLAFIGDGVYDLLVRSYVVNLANRPVGELNKIKVSFVNCKAQAEFMKKLMPQLTEQELSVYKRGRNAKSNTTPKNADMADYRKATGFEALIGFLYLSGENERLHELMNIAYENALEK